MARGTRTVGIVGGLESKLRQTPCPQGYELRYLGGYRSHRVRAAHVDLVVLLTRWMSHSAFHTARSMFVQIVSWDRGIGELLKELPTLLPLPEPAPQTTALVEESAPATPIPTNRPPTVSDNILIALSLDPDRCWTSAEIYSLVGGFYPSVRARISKLIEEGQIEVANAGARFCVRNPRQLRLARTAMKAA